MRWQEPLQLDNLPNNIVEQGRRLMFSPCEVIWRESQAFEYFYIIQQGSVKLTHEDEIANSLIIDIYHPGDFFGEIQMAGLKTSSRMITSLTNCEILRFTKQQFQTLWHDCPPFSIAVFRVLCQRMSRSGDDKAFSERAFLRHRVYRIIKANLNSSGYFRYDKEILREIACVSLRSLNRSLKELENDRLIELDRGTIKLLSADDLME
ncbi:MAG TPA: Crp/Fnr family transcriptional regulator [Clostridia bacterium]|nr:Crp/Fnr family transcriptional regulator [Clostridia bacterium]